jgi:hypothetical protein
VISADVGGHVEYWDASDYNFPNKKIEFQYKSSTDLYEFAKVEESVIVFNKKE